MQAEWLRLIWYLNFGGALALILSLARNGLYRVYPFLFAYLATDATQTTVLLLLRAHSNAYGWTYVFSQLAKVVLAVFVIAELYRVALAQRPALARFGRNAVGQVLAAAAVLALSFLVLDSSIRPGHSQILHRVNSFERTMDIWMLVVLMIICIFMAWSLRPPRRLRRRRGPRQAASLHRNIVRVPRSVVVRYRSSGAGR